MFAKSARDSVSQLRIPSPCSVAWDSMIGNDRVRFCEHCQLTVHNVDLASPKQIKRLIARSQGRLCVNYLNPAPPKPPTPILYQIGRRSSVIAVTAFSATLGISTAIAATANLKQTALVQQPTYTRRLATRSVSGGARLHGYIFDPNGAVITGAQVTLTDSETNLPVHSFTSADGQYQFEGLKPGTYHLKVISKGFETSDLPNLSVRANDNNRIDQTLSIAPVEADVTVTAPPENESFRGGGAVAITRAAHPLVQAAMDDDLEALKTILLRHPDVNVRDKETQYTALDRAVLNGNREMVQVLIWAKADVNARDSDGETPLMMIGEDTTSEIVWDLINNGAKVNLRDEDGDTALIAVAEYDNVEALKVLLDAGAKVNVTNNEGQTALMIAAERGKVHNVRALILAGADVNARDKEGKTALMLAQENDESAVIRLLKAHGAIEFEAPQKQ